ncbi:MAG: hypothetical protein NTW28_30200 [Candidatus Solibacter sp.]|nr:hypothetical protein [Candidatus Solibacter sp.]
MRFRTLALALALSCGVSGVAEAAAKNPVVRRTKHQKIKKQKRFKQAKSSKVKPRKAKKVTRARK